MYLYMCLPLPGRPVEKYQPLTFFSADLQKIIEDLFKNFQIS